MQLTKFNKLPMDEIANRLTTATPIKREMDENKNATEPTVKVSAMAEILASKFRDLDKPVAPHITPTPNRVSLLNIVVIFHTQIIENKKLDLHCQKKFNFQYINICRNISCGVIEFWFLNSVKFSKYSPNL